VSNDVPFGLLSPTDSRQSRPVPDPLVKIYDLRSMKPLSPLPFPSGPAFINLLPMRSSSLVVTSNQGLVNIVDTSNPTSANEFYQVLAMSFHARCTSYPKLPSWTHPPSSVPQPSPPPEYIWHSETRME
jgi:hypothetical protein